MLAYLHDCCRCIFFAAPNCFQSDEVVLNLPCEDALWNAETPEQWLAVLQGPSRYGSMHQRLTGVSLQKVMAHVLEPRQLIDPAIITPFGAFVTIHVILKDLFALCTEHCTSSAFPATGNDDAIFKLQFALHNWLQCWMSCPDLPSVSPGEEPTFFNNGKTRRQS